MDKGCPPPPSTLPHPTSQGWAEGKKGIIVQARKDSLLNDGGEEKKRETGRKEGWSGVRKGGVEGGHVVAQRADNCCVMQRPSAQHSDASHPGHRGH